MRLVRVAIENQRRDLTTHTIILATARLLDNGDKSHISKGREKKRHPKGKSER